MPKRKVAVGALSGAIVVVALWVASQFFGINQPDFVAAAEVVIVSTGLAYLIPEADQA